MANYLYNGVELPDINEVWTDKETYPYACISYVSEMYYLAISSCTWIWDHSYETLSNAIAGSAKVYAIGSSETEWTFGAEATFDDTGNGHSLLDNPIWTNHDILNADGTVYLAASDPVPVEEPTSTFDQQSFLMGLACGLLGKGLPKMIGEEPEDDPESEWPISWNTVEIASNPVQVTLDGTTFVKVSDYIPTKEELSSISLSVEQSGTYYITLPCTGVQEFDCGFMAMYNDYYPVLSVTSAGENADFPETGFYVLAMEEDFTFSIIFPQLYTYNGMELPILPDYDEELYPYAFILSFDGGVYGDEYAGSSLAQLILTDTMPYAETSDGTTSLIIENGHSRLLYDTTDSEALQSYLQSLSDANVFGLNCWELNKEGYQDIKTTYAGHTFVWANTDTYYEDGTLCLAASEPVAV